MSAEPTTRALRQRAKADVEGASERLQEPARDARHAGGEKFSIGTERAAADVGDLADAVDTAASRLSQLEQQSLADYTHQLASYLSDMSARLRETNVDGLTDDVRKIAQRHPGLLILGSVVLGLSLSRYARTSHDTNVDESVTMRQGREDTKQRLHND